MRHNFGQGREFLENTIDPMFPSSVIISKVIRIYFITTVLGFLYCLLTKQKDEVLKIQINEPVKFFNTYLDDGVSWNQGYYNSYKDVLATEKLRTKFKKSAHMQCPQDLTYVVLVVSSSKGAERRSAIRSTWGPDHSINIRWKTIFVTAGDPVKSGINTEMAQFADIIHCESCGDTFRLTPPKVAAGIEWILRYCTVDYIVKVEDDTYINHVNLLKYLKEQAIKKKHVFFGGLNPSNDIPRRGMRALSKDVWPDSKGKFQDHCFMSGVVMSSDVALALVESINLRMFFSLEDVYLNGVIKNATGLTCENNNKFWMQEFECKFRGDEFIMQHPATVSCLHELNRKILKLQLLPS